MAIKIANCQELQNLVIFAKRYFVITCFYCLSFLSAERETVRIQVKTPIPTLLSSENLTMNTYEYEQYVHRGRGYNNDGTMNAGVGTGPVLPQPVIPSVGVQRPSNSSLVPSSSDTNETHPRLSAVRTPTA